MPPTRNLILITASAFCVGLAGVVATKHLTKDSQPAPPVPRAVPTERADQANRTDREPSVWEKAAQEQVAHEAQLQAEAAEKAAREQAEEEQVERERVAQEKSDPQREALERIARDRAARVESALASEPIVRARQRANENAAIATLRSIAAAQAQCLAAQVIDTNADGDGEYGYLAELAGTVPIREFTASGPSVGPAAIRPALLTSSMGDVQDGGMEHGAVERSGYLFKVFLPDSDGAGVAEAVTGGGTGVASQIDSERGEKLYCAYAWPITRGQTGDRAFFVNQSGDVYVYSNEEGTFEGTQAPPNCSAAFGKESMSSRLTKDWTLLE